MPTAFNKYHCMGCGQPVPKENVVYLGNSRVWICDDVECNRELEREEQMLEEEAQERAERDRYERYW